MTNAATNTKNDYDVELRGTWYFNLTVWADTPAQARDEAICRIQADHGPIDLGIHTVTVNDDATGEEMLEWKQ